MVKLFSTPYRWLPTTIHKNLWWWVRSIKWFFQRGHRGYADYDVWSTDSYICEVTLNMLKELRKYHSGFPINDECKTEEDWNAILDKMIEGFEAGHRFLEDNYNYLDISPEGLKQWQEASKKDRELFENHGLPLFAKWYFALWD